MSLLSRLGPRETSATSRPINYGNESLSLQTAFENEDSDLASKWFALDLSNLNPSETDEETDFDAAQNSLISCFNTSENDSSEAFSHFNFAAQLVLNNLAQETGWVLGPLRQLNLTLFRLAKKAGGLEEAARTMNKAFSVCATDRVNPITKSRKWGIYYLANILFRTYFCVNKLNLCNNLIRSFKGLDLPPLEAFPVADRVTYCYYIGVLAFYEEQYSKAQENLSFALQNFAPLTSPERIQNRVLLLTHLIPINLLTGISPSPALFEAHPQLDHLFRDLVGAIGAGLLGTFDDLLAQKQKALIKAGVYLTMERCRLICFRNLAKRVFLIREKNTRLVLQDILTAVTVAGCVADMDEIECMVANLIDKGLLKGYISHEKLVLVLSPNNAFPALSSVSV
ncbi:hypothetical protein BDR26DRAFT_821474 [Obelidium mucronatum]|nr:hypothetical protein BDR26DRAFT_821474 [Obelidium mucronatum]